MIVTEREAKRMRCPMARSNAAGTCVGRGCMMWRVEAMRMVVAPRVYYSFQSKYINGHQVSPAITTEEWINAVEGIELESGGEEGWEMTGHCGLGGKPK